MRITVLGKSPSFPDVGGACSGYLVEGGGQKVLLDCGPGVFAKLRTVVDYAEIDAIVISHLHADHVMDLVPYASGIRYRSWDGPPPHPRLIAPPGAPDVFSKLCEGGSMSPDHLELAFDLSVYDPAESLSLGGLEVRFQPVPHYIPANAVEFAAGGARFTFGADCGPSDDLASSRRHRPADGRGDVARTRAAGRPRPPHAVRSRRARGAGRREAAGIDALRR